MGFDLPSVPVVDLSQPEEEAADVLKLAALEIGFFYVKEHGVDEEVLHRMFQASRAFFSLKMEQKLSITVNKWNRGYTKLDDEYLDPEKQKEPDTKEGMYIGREVPPSEYDAKRLAGPNQYPDEALIPGFKEAMLAYFAACLACTHKIVRLLALSLGLPANYFEEHFSQPLASLRPLHYTAAVSSPAEGRFGAGAHTDYGMVTILATDEVPGLQVEVDDEWVAIPPKPGHLIVNLGDLLHRWTNGNYRSALHRVVTTSKVERYSTAFFVEPNFDSLVEPLPQCCSSEDPARWPPITSGAYLLSRYNATRPSWAEQEKQQAAGAQHQPSKAPTVRAF